MRPEDKLQLQVCTYIKYQYPDVVLTFDASGFKLSKGMAVRAKKMRSDDRIPDIAIYEPVAPYHGLFIELKAKNIYKKDGTTLLANEHVEEQAKTLAKLRAKGYKAEFAIGFDQAQQLIDDYMNGSNN